MRAAWCVSVNTDTLTTSVPKDYQYFCVPGLIDLGARENKSNITEVLRMIETLSTF